MNNIYFRCALEFLNILFLFATIASGQESCHAPGVENGLCVPYNDCPFVIQLTQNYGSFEAIPKFYLKYVYKSKCSAENEPIRLCCKMPRDYVPPPPPTTAPKTDPRLTEDLDYDKDFSSQFNAQGIRILEQYNCGTDDGNRIAGGEETELAEFPWMALLRYDGPGEQFRCGGALISDRYVLTATHCVNSAVYPVIGVRLGEHNLDTNPDCKIKLEREICMPPVEDFGVDNVITHPKYNQSKSINDIALIKLNRTVEFKIHIKPVCLPITKPSYESYPDEFTIAGWGATEIKYSTKSKVLLKADVSRERKEVCENRYSAFHIVLSRKHICAADLQTGRDTCRGDSGGPLFAFTFHSEKKAVKNYVQFGIVAAGGLGCKLDQKFPGIYTNVVTFLPWITNNIVY